MSEEVKKRYDKEANASYYYLDATTQRTVAKTVEVSEHCLVDVDSEGYPIGVEVLF